MVVPDPALPDLLPFRLCRSTEPTPTPIPTPKSQKVSEFLWQRDGDYAYTTNSVSIMNSKPIFKTSIGDLAIEAVRLVDEANGVVAETLRLYWPDNEPIDLHPEN